MNKKQIYYILAILCALTTLAGCSLFISTPRIARYHVQGLNNQSNEYIVPLDGPDESNMDIPISERYAVQFDFEWLWNSDNELSEVAGSGEACEVPSLTPWMVCKYRF